MHESISYQILPESLIAKYKEDDSWPKHLYYPGDVFSSALISDSVNEGEFVINREKHFLFSVNP